MQNCDGLCEIEEERDQTSSVNGDSAFGIDGADHSNDVYVAVGRGPSSVDAVAWALRHTVTPSTSAVYLVHVFPEVHYIPTPLGKLRKSQVSAEQIESYMSQERRKRRDMLGKYLNMCQAYQVQAETLLIESDIITKAVVDLIQVLNIKSLIVGTSKSSLRSRKKGSSSSKADQIYKNAPMYCEVKIVCEGSEVSPINRTAAATPSPVHGNSNVATLEGPTACGDEDSSSCTCFSRKFI
ncbi:hypothetical protein QJS10_CPA05g02014 [Acorus calamus]|uniref:UspA domain-containing protein n=1 Tax=Acorus calamus TaxID=4465 RepID=A0AAV9EU61_ACOCL|nr:hypothetical protein QJS10_CPA05g02014 [Acorus calamus]